MGQAKLRGGREVRVQQALERVAAQRVQQEQARIAAKALEGARGVHSEVRPHCLVPVRDPALTVPSSNRQARALTPGALNVAAIALLASLGS